MARIADSIYSITIPSIADSSYNFNMTSTIDGKQFFFNFKYFSARWNCYCSIDGGLSRDVGVYPYVLSWSRYSDYSVYFIFDGDTIAYGDLSFCQIGVVKWKP